MDNNIMPTDREDEMGFVLQTLVYTDNFELEKLGGHGKERMEEAVAIVVDDDNRIKRCQFNNGYIHERREKGGWKTAAFFANADELQDSCIYADYLAGLPEAEARKDNIE